MSAPTPEEIARVQAWEKEQKANKAAGAKRERQERVQRIQDRLQATFVGKTIASIKANVDYDYDRGAGWSTEVYDIFEVRFTDGTIAEFEGQRDSSAIDVNVVKPQADARKLTDGE